MFPLCFLSSAWTLLQTFFLRLWPRVSNNLKVIDIEKDGPNFPSTPKAAKTAAEAFRQSLLPRAVEALASQYNSNKSCEVIGNLYGSFNVCFFVEFKHCGTRWAIRVPVEPLLHDAWAKLQSEVATLNHIRSRTTIPVPAVYAFGKDATLTKDKTKCQMFLISELIPGAPLTSERLTSAGEIAQRRFFQQVFDYLAQLRNLEFPALGSLMPTTSDDPVIGNLLSFTTDHFAYSAPSLRSAQDYMLLQYCLLEKQADRLNADFSESECRYELFALHHLREAFNRFIKDSLNTGPFILHHPDLHFGNILVGSDLEILGIVDWEFAHIVPLQLFTPPLWAIHQEEGRDKLSYAFYQGLSDAASTDARFQKLFDEWYGEPKFNEAFYYARIIRYPTDVMEVFSRHFTRSIDDEAKAESDFFTQNPEKAARARLQASRNAQWKQYLLNCDA